MTLIEKSRLGVLIIGLLTYLFFYLKPTDTRNRPPQQHTVGMFKYIFIPLIFSTFWETFSVLSGKGSITYAFHLPPIVGAIGDVLWLLAIILFVNARMKLADQYSPCFAAKLPTDIRSEGPYGMVRHPIYSANIMLVLGLVLSTGSFLIIINGLILFYFYYKSAQQEEQALAQAFPEYKSYQERVPQFIPKLRLVRNDNSVKNSDII